MPENTSLSGLCVKEGAGGDRGVNGLPQRRGSQAGKASAGKEVDEESACGQNCRMKK